MSLPDAVMACIAADVPVLLWGPPGVGKTAALMAAARVHGAHTEVLIGSSIDPLDVGGHLVVGSDGLVRQLPPPWAHRARAVLDAGRPVWLFFDELSCAPPSVQAALLRVIQERHVAGVSLYGCRVVGAANPADTAADGGWLSPATSNRWAHVEWAINAAEWCIGALTGWGTPLSAAQAEVAASVCNWIGRSPEALLSPPKDLNSSRAWPSPRSWSAAIMAMASLPGGLVHKQATQVMAACVGAGATSEWDAYRVGLDLPDPEAVLAGRVSLPRRGDQLYATMLAVVAAAASLHPEREARLNQAVTLVTALRPDQALSPARALLAALDGNVPTELRHLGEALLHARATVNR